MRSLRRAAGAARLTTAIATTLLALALVPAGAGAAEGPPDGDTTAASADAALEDVLAGFDDAEEDDAGELDAVLEGFDDEPGAADDLDAVLDGFDTVPGGQAEPGRAAGDRRPESWIDRYLELTGKGSLGASYNVRPHFSNVGPQPGGTYYGNLQRLRARADVQADVDFPSGVRGRIQAYAYYDFAYEFHGRDKYTERVLQDYELEGEILDFWFAGRVNPHLDVKLGRQVVNWGRSDTLRVTDVLNALNNREPGLVDIEELRLPSTMARVDAYWGAWNLTALVIPEIRYDYDPPPGSDFYPSIDVRDIPEPPPGFPLTRDEVAVLIAQQAGQAFLQDPPSLRANRWGSTPEFGASLTGIFSGWDVSLYVARIYQNRTTTVVSLPTLASTGILTDDDRVTLVGAGGNYTIGSWLFKAEIAWLDELDYAYLKANPAWQPTDPIPGYTVDSGRFSRLDWMLGVEYYGVANVTFALEVAHRHVFDYVDELQYLPNYVYRDNIETALRVTSEHLNQRLDLTLLGLVLVNDAGLLGATLRFSAEYELAAGLAVTGGYLHFFGADQVPFDTWQHNDRLFAKIRYSF